MCKRSSAPTLALFFAFSALAACAGPRPSDLPPAPASSFTVSVRDGTSVKAVAERYQVKEDDVLALNKISDRNSLSGRIRIPAYGHDRQPLAADAPRPGPRLQQIVAQPPPQTV